MPIPDDDVIEFAGRMFAAAREGDHEVLLPEIDAGLPVSLTNHKGDSLLILAAYHGHADLVAELLQRGADPDLANDNGHTPLAGATFKGFEDVASVLLDSGADPQAGTPNSIDMARMFGRDELLRRFTEG